MILSIGLLCFYSSIPKPHFPHRQAPNILAGERMNCRPSPGTMQYVVLHVWPSHIESLWEHLILVLPIFLLQRQLINNLSPVPSTHSIPIMGYTTETQMALFNLRLDPKNFDQMIQDRNSRTVTHFITRAAMCATVNSLSTPRALSSLVFDQKAKKWLSEMCFVW